MASTIKLTNANGKNLSLKNSDGNQSDINVSYFNSVADITALFF